MGIRKYLACVAGVAGCASLLIARVQPILRVKSPARILSKSRNSRFGASPGQTTTQGVGINPWNPLASPPETRTPSPVSIPVTMEENVGQAPARIAFIGRGKGLTTLLTNDGFEVLVGRGASQKGTGGLLKLQLSETPRKRRKHRKRRSRRRATAKFAWQGERRLLAESNYLLGNDPRLWRTHVAHFARAEAKDVLPAVGVAVYGNEEGIEYDLVLEPGADADALRLQASGADAQRLDPEGNLLLQVGPREIRMRKPRIYEEPADHQFQGPVAAQFLRKRKPVEGAFELHADGSIGFRIGPHEDGMTLVVDPSLSISYSTFLGGIGEDVANSIALDSTGKIYIGGTTTSMASFPEAGGKRIGPAGGATEFFVAKMDPGASGSNSLLYLTFLGGSGNQAGGLIAVDSAGDVAITGTTTSPDYPVTDGSKRTTGSNDIAVTELDPTGSMLKFSTMFGGSGTESTQGTGGIALDAAGDIFVASDTNSTDLTTTTGAYQVAYGGGTTDGFLAKFLPLVTPHLQYCTYLGIHALVGIGGVAVDAGNSAYIAGFTSDPGTSLSTLNGFQSTYGGDPFDAFLMKIRPSGAGANDLAFGTFLGGSNLDKALAVSVGEPMPATAYVTGTTESPNFPLNGTIVGPQTSLKGTANAFVAAISQDAISEMTSLVYSTLLGGSESDSGLGIVAKATNELYVTGNTTSFDFPRMNNFQPFNGDVDAFVVKLDPTASGSSSLLYASPLGGTATVGNTAMANGNGIAADGSGHVFLAGRTTAADFPRAGSSGNGFQLLCTSCQASPPLADVFVIAIQENTSAAPSASFTSPKINFGQQIVGAQNIPPLFAGVTNTGGAPLDVSGLAIVGPNSSDFALSIVEACMTAPILPGATCSFEVAYLPSVVGPEQAFVSITDDAPGSPQLLQIEGIGGGPLAILSPTSQDFGSVQVGSSTSTVTMSLINAGNQNLTISQFAKGGPGASQFIVQDFACTFGSVIPPQSNCSFGVAFTPTGTGSYSAEIDITDDSGGVLGTRQVIPLTGTGVAPAPLANLLPAMLTYGAQTAGTTSLAQLVTLTNVGQSALTLASVMLVGSDPGNFAILPNAGSKPCPVTGGILSIGAACTVSVNFTPLSGGTKNAMLSFADNASGNPQTVAISGTGVSPMIQLSATTLNLGTQSVGIGSSQNLNLISTGNSPVGFNSISITGVNAGDFSQTSTCFPSIGAQGSCIITVMFDPEAAGNRSATLNIIDNALGSPQTVGLSGIGAAAGVLLSPTSVNFSSQVVGSPSSPVAITVKNTGQGALVISPISPNSFIGTNAGDFSETDNCSSSIAPGGTCAIQVIFNPSCANSSATRTATLNLTDNAATRSQSIPLTGTGSGSFCIAPSTGGSTLATVTPGQTATYHLNLVTMNGFSGPISVACTGGPPESQCMATQGTANVAANSSTPLQINVATTGPTQASSSTLAKANLSRYGLEETTRRENTSSQFDHAMDVLICLALLTFACPLGRGAHKNRVKRCAAALLMALGLSACGGNSAVANLDPGTPPGSSMLTVSATSTAPGSTRTITLTLVVVPAKQ
jgi:hypothetical protein